jgi:hypothetical protein
VARAVPLAGLLTLVLPAIASPPALDPERLADAVRELYAVPLPGERWRRLAIVRMPDGTQVPREQAYRSDPEFVRAARVLLSSRTGDDAPLGAWLLATALEGRWAEVEPVLVDALVSGDERVVFEAVEALARRGGAPCRRPLVVLARSAPWPAVRTAAGLAGGC